VIELSKDVLYEGRFKKANPDYITGKPCVYVGMTGLDPDVRFDKHKAGIQSNRYVKEFGLRLASSPTKYRSTATYTIFRRLNPCWRQAFADALP
jgi:hypothetical protein